MYSSATLSFIYAGFKARCCSLHKNEKFAFSSHTLIQNPNHWNGNWRWFKMSIHVYKHNKKLFWTKKQDIVFCWINLRESVIWGIWNFHPKDLDSLQLRQSFESAMTQTPKLHNCLIGSSFKDLSKIKNRFIVKSFFLYFSKILNLQCKASVTMMGRLMNHSNWQHPLGKRLFWKHFFLLLGFFLFSFNKKI